MKTNLLKSAVLVATFLGALGSASAETLRASIPFGFSAAGKTMPAGNYAIRTIENLPAALLFENEQTKVRILVLVRPTAGSLVQPALRLTFADTGNEHMDLANIASYDEIYELNIHSKRKVLRGVALTLNSAGK